MAGEILVVATAPGPRPLGAGELRIGSYDIVFFYRLLPPICDCSGAKVAPTPRGALVSTVGQDFIDRYVAAQELAALDSGDLGWEYISGQRQLIREEGGSLSVETVDQMVARVRAEYPIRKQRAMADWTAQHQHRGRRFDAPE